MREGPAGVFSVRRRALWAASIGLALALGTSTVAAAFSAQAGFSATTYASGYPVGAPSGVAFVTGTMYTADPTDSGLYRNATSGTPVRVGTIPGAPTGLAASGTLLYAIDTASNRVVQLDPATGAVLATLATSTNLEGHTASGIAADPGTGDLWVSTTQAFIYKIPALAPRTPAFVLTLTGFPTTFGIAVGSDHSIYVAVEGPGANGVRQITPSLAQSPIGPDYLGARGIGVIPGFIFVNNADGSITKIVIPGVGTGSNAIALTGGAAGSSAAIGSDGCFYASQGSAVVRLANADGSCNLASAAPPPPPPALTLVRTSTNPPLIGNGDQSFSATLANVANPSNIRVTFTVTRGTVPTTYLATTGPNGVASFGYAATTVGTDVVTASAVVNRTTITSNTISVTYPRALDTVPPKITYRITSGAHNAPGPNGAFYSCPNPTLGKPGVTEYCGWYTSPPTVHFTVTRGPGGLTDPIYSCPDFTLTVNSPITGTPTTCNATNGDLVPATFTVVLQALISAPTVTPMATTPVGQYASGTWTNQNVMVSFACATDAALGPSGISQCSSPQTVSAEGTTTVSGAVVDVAGTRVTTTFGPIQIDKTPPVVTATMTTATDGLRYVPGTPTTQDVIVTFSCTDDLDPAPTCPALVRVTAGPSVTVTASDRATNSKSYTFYGINIDRTAPTVTAAITPTPDANGNNALSATVTITATDPSGIGSITYSATGVQKIPTTVVIPVGQPSPFSIPVALNVVGTTTLTYSAVDSLGNVSAARTVTVKIISTQPTTLTILSSSSQPQGATVVSARLLGLGGLPVPGKAVAFAAGAASVSATTDANGVATTTLALAPGSYALTAGFAAVTGYLHSSAGPQTLTVYGLTQFVIWGGNAGGIATGQRVVFWGEHWWDHVTLPEKAKVKDFRGWAVTVIGATWSTKSGNSKPPRPIPTYISVIITTSIERVHGGDTTNGDRGARSRGHASTDDIRSGDEEARIRGNVVGHAILRVDAPHGDEPGMPVSGVVVAVIP